MQIKIKDILNFNLAARDGLFAKIDDILFDDQNWDIRYIAVKSPDNSPASKTLICPYSLIDSINPINGIVRFLGFCRDIITLGSIESDPPVSLQKRIGRRNLFSFLPSQFAGFKGFAPHLFYPIMRKPAESDIEREYQENISNYSSSLRSSREVIGYSLQFNNSVRGRVHDLVLDTASGRLDSIVVKCGRFLKKMTMNLPIAVVKDINWETVTVSVYIDEFDAREFVG
jgi:sporulation protein YlmC with PRC-barrel domain